MFNLELAIAEWRGQLAAGGIKSPEVLDELESHLRDESDRQMKSGLSAEEAFEKATESVGAVRALKTEFTKIDSSRAQNIARVAIATVYLVACAPRLFTTNVSHLGQISGVIAVVMTVFVILRQKACRQFLFSAVPSLRARRTFKAAFWMVALLGFVGCFALPHNQGQWAVAFLWVLACTNFAGLWITDTRAMAD
jgi:hypothetical protein